MYEFDEVFERKEREKIGLPKPETVSVN